MVDISGHVARMAEASLEAEEAADESAAPESVSQETAAAEQTADPAQESLVKYAANIDVATLEAKATEAANAAEAQAAKKTAAELRAEQAAVAEAAAVQAEGTSGISVVNANAALNVRSTPSEEGELLGRLYGELASKVQQVEGEWSKVLSRRGKRLGTQFLRYPARRQRLWRRR